MKKVLVIDDNEDLNECIVEVLKLKGYHVISAHNGLDGFQLFKREKPDLIISDLMMPERDGMWLLKELKALGNDCFPCKILAISGGGQVDGIQYLELAESYGVDASLCKPFGIEELEDKVSLLLQ